VSGFVWKRVYFGLTDDEEVIQFFLAIRRGRLFLVDNEGCTTGLCVAAWATRVALFRM